VPLGEDIPLKRGHQRGVPPVEIVILPIGSSSVRTVADRHKLAAYIVTNTADDLFGGTNINDLERP